MSRPALLPSRFGTPAQLEILTALEPAEGPTAPSTSLIGGLLASGGVGVSLGAVVVLALGGAVAGVHAQEVDLVAELRVQLGQHRRDDALPDYRDGRPDGFCPEPGIPAPLLPGNGEPTGAVAVVT